MKSSGVWVDILSPALGGEGMTTDTTAANGWRGGRWHRVSLSRAEVMGCRVKWEGRVTGKIGGNSSTLFPLGVVMQNMPIYGNCTSRWTRCIFDKVSWPKVQKYDNFNNLWLKFNFRPNIL